MRRRPLRGSRVATRPPGQVKPYDTESDPLRPGKLACATDMPSAAARPSPARNEVTASEARPVRNDRIRRISTPSIAGSVAKRKHGGHRGHEPLGCGGIATRLARVDKREDR